MTELKTAEEISKETYYENLACEILKGVEFKDEQAIAQAIIQLSDYLRSSTQTLTDE